MASKPLSFLRVDRSKRNTTAILLPFDAATFWEGPRRPRKNRPKDFKR